MITPIPYQPNVLHEYQDANKPLHLDLSQASEAGFIQDLNAAGLSYVDRLDQQLLELARIENPSEPPGTDFNPWIESHLQQANATLFSYGHWVLFPWKKCVVHLLPPSTFRRVRESSNRNKITEEEQEVLRTKRVGIIGLSVGHCCALTIAQESLCGTLHLADFDTLSLANLNRLRSSTINLGQPKTTIACREIAELDPYLELCAFHEGLTDDNIMEFCTGGGKLDVIIEECDNLYFKLKIREIAAELGIPVIMETSDRGILDVERFDLEPNRPPFHGALGNTTSQQVKDYPAEKLWELIFKLYGGIDNLSPRMKESIAVLNQELVTYPQLASDIQLGGATSAHLVRKVLLGQSTASGRVAVDLTSQLDDQEISHPFPTTD